MKNAQFRILLIAALLLVLAVNGIAQTVPPAGKDQAAQLVAVLKSDAPQKDKADACRQLAIVGTKDAVPVLAGLLADEKLAHMARYALEPIPDPAVDEALREALGRLKGRLLVGVIGSIGVRRDAKAVEPVARMLQDPDAEVVQAAARALGKIGSPDAAKALQSALASAIPANQLAVCDGLFRAAEALSAKGQREEAAAVYQRLRELKQAPQQVRAAALRGAILLGGKDAAALLRQNLGSSDYVLFATAVKTSFELPEADVTEALASELKGLVVDRQLVVLKALGKRKDKAALPAILTAAKAGEKPVRLAAVQALVASGEPTAVVGLLELMRDTDNEMAKAAQDGLAALPGKEVDEAVMAMFTNAETARRLTGLDLIGQRRMMTALPALLKAMADPDAQIRAAAVRRLGELGGQEEVPALLDLLTRAKSPEDMGAAEEALSAVCARADNPEICVTKLGGLMQQAQPPQKAALVRVLGKAGGSASLKAVRAAVGDPNADVRTTAIRTLASWKTVDAASDLLALAQSAAAPTDKMLGLRGYLRWAASTDVPANERLSMCRQAASLVQKPEEKKLLLSALGGIESADAVALIAPFLDDAATRNEAVAAAVMSAEKTLKGPQATQAAAKLIEPLEKVAKAATDAEMTRRATSALQQAKQKAPPAK